MRSCLPTLSDTPISLEKVADAVPPLNSLTLKDSKQSLSDVTAAFSVEALTKQFYKDLFDWYQWAVDPASGVYFPNNTSTEDDDREDIETKIIRMITRIMFVWFIKQKELVPNKIF